MKTLTILMAFLVTTASTAVAQPRGGRPPGGPPPHEGPMGMGPGPEAILELATELKLKETQKTQIRDLLDETRKDHVRLRAELEVNEIDLHRALDADEPDEKKVTDLIAKISDLEKQLRTSRITTWLKVRKLLTKEQRSKLEELHEKRRDEMRQRHRLPRAPSGPELPPYAPQREERGPAPLP